MGGYTDVFQSSSLWGKTHLIKMETNYLPASRLLGISFFFLLILFSPLPFWYIGIEIIGKENTSNLEKWITFKAFCRKNCGLFHLALSKELSWYKVGSSLLCSESLSGDQELMTLLCYWDSGIFYLPSSLVQLGQKGAREDGIISGRQHLTPVW